MDEVTVTAEELAKKQREISVAEFFEKNKQILGFDSLPRALLTAVKEGVDNALDACEEASILPEVEVKIERTNQTEYRVMVQDNGPGIVKKQVPNIFGRLLYGSRFHQVRQARGSQGIGISAVVMYAQLTSGKPARIRTKTMGDHAAYEVELILDTKRNRAEPVREDWVAWDIDHGTRLEVSLKGKYVGGKQSISEYLRASAIVNPHARLQFIDPDRGRHVFERASDTPPAPTKEIMPHPEGIELGELLRMAKATESQRMTSFLTSEFSRISYRVAREICDVAGTPQDLKPSELTLEQASAILGAIKQVKIMAPETDCLSPIGEMLIRKGLKNVLGDLKAAYYAPPVSREPKVSAGNPFIVEVGMVYGGQLNREEPAQVLRFANRVPLLYQQGACAITQAIEAVDWRRYGLEQRGGQGLPYGPAIILVHVCSTRVPYTSESKEAIANVPEIREEIELALRACARRLKTHLNKAQRKAKSEAKFEIVQEILPKIAEKSAKIVRKKVPPLAATITKIMNVVWVDVQTASDEKAKRQLLTVRLFNYTPTGKSFKLHALVPRESFDLKHTKPEPSEVRDGDKLTWELKRIPSTGEVDLVLAFRGAEKESLLDEVELFSSGIDPAGIIGAEPMPGDWDIERLEVTEEGAEPAAPAEPAEEAEADYDEEGEVLDEEQ